MPFDPSNSELLTAISKRIEAMEAAEENRSIVTRDQVDFRFALEALRETVRALNIVKNKAYDEFGQDSLYYKSAYDALSNARLFFESIYQFRTPKGHL